MMKNRLNRLLICLLSVATLLFQCKPVLAEEKALPNDFWNGFRLGGYSSASVILHRDEANEAAVNEVSMMLSWNGDSRWSFFGELEVERPVAWNDDDKFGRKEFHPDLERLYLDYNFSENANLRMGRFLTPNSHWNLLHASPLVWTGTRPIATYRLFPTATNGLMLHGSSPFSDYVLDYMVFAELLEDQEKDKNDLLFEHVYGARLALSKQWDVGLSLLSFTEKDIQAFAGQNKTYHMAGVDFLTHLNNVELSGEGFARFTQNGGDGGGGAYLQTAVPIKNNWYWVTRLESMHRPNEGSYGRWVTGATWRIKPTQLLKLEFAGGSGDLPEAPRGFVGSFAILF